VKTAMTFALGMFVGAMMLQGGGAQSNGVRGLNHVGMVVKDYDKAMNFYTKTLGFREAYTIRRADGSVQLTYLQLNRDTFVELIPAGGANQQPGITHFGIEVDNVQAAATQLRAKGLTVPNPAPTPSNAQSIRIQDPEGVQIEVMEFVPNSLQRKAIDGWK
jgi:lactoylglutathione lyase